MKGPADSSRYAASRITRSVSTGGHRLAVRTRSSLGSRPATSETMIAIILNLCSPLLVRLEMVMVTVQLGCCDTRRLERYVWLTWSVWCASMSLSPHLQPEVQLVGERDGGRAA